MDTRVISLNNFTSAIINVKNKQTNLNWETLEKSLSQLTAAFSNAGLTGDVQYWITSIQSDIKTQTVFDVSYGLLINWLAAKQLTVELQNASPDVTSLKTLLNCLYISVTNNLGNPSPDVYSDIMSMQNILQQGTVTPAFRQYAAALSHVLGA